MAVRSSIVYFSCSVAYCVSALSATGCSSSSSGTPNTAQSDMDGSRPDDGTSRDDATDATMDIDGSGHDDSPSPADSGAPEAPTVNTGAAGDAGASQFCAAVCAGLYACAADAGVEDAGSCHCTPGSAAIERTDFVEAFTSCVRSAIARDCSDAGGAVQDCQVAAAASIEPSPAAAVFCKNLEFTFCANILPDCLTNAGIYSDTTISAFTNCLPELPDADVDGGCTNFGLCLNGASTPL